MLEKERGVSFADAIGLRMLAEPGRQGDHPVTYFRVYDPADLAGTDREPPEYDDLAADFILHSGHIGEDNTIVLDELLRPS